MKIIGCDFHTRYQQIAMVDEGRVARPLVLSHVTAPACHTILTSQHYAMIQVFGCSVLDAFQGRRS